MTLFFRPGGNPFATPVGEKIEQATDASLASENWGLNIEICDIINETEDGPKDAIKAIRKRLQQAVGKNYTVVLYTLTVLETCVKNCGKRFHVLVCNKEFVSELVKLIGPKNEPPTAVQEKVLSLIQSWADAFHQNTEMSGVVQMYQELKAKGIEFPMTDLDAMAPIHTPQKVTKSVVREVETVDYGRQEGVGEARTESPNPALAGPINLSQDQLGKLKHELDIVQNNITVFGDMLNEMAPANEHPADWQLLQELNLTCREMQERLVELISKLSNDEVTAELLRINDLLNNLFLRYSRYEKNREARLGGKEETGTRGKEEGAASLIDLEDDPIPSNSTGQITSQLSALGLGSQLASLNTVSAHSGSKEKEDSEFDVLAQSRNTGGSTYEANRKPDQISGSLGALTEARAQGNTASANQPDSILMMHKESDFDEMAAWLGEGGGTEESLTSSEFERFLAERAAAAEALPSQPPTQNKDPDKDASLFAL